MMTRHFVWLVPVINSLLFLAFGALCALATWRWPRRGGWLSLRLILVWAVLPTLLLVGRGIYAEAKVLLAMGFAVVSRPGAGACPGRPSTMAPLVVRRPGGQRC